MTKYSQIAKTFLQQNNPGELARLKREEKLQVFLEDLDELFEDQEQKIIPDTHLSHGI